MSDKLILEEKAIRRFSFFNDAAGHTIVIVKQGSEPSSVRIYSPERYALEILKKNENFEFFF